MANSTMPCTHGHAGPSNMLETQQVTKIAPLTYRRSHGGCFVIRRRIQQHISRGDTHLDVVVAQHAVMFQFFSKQADKKAVTLTFVKFRDDKKTDAVGMNQQDC